MHFKVMAWVEYDIEAKDVFEARGKADERLSEILTHIASHSFSLISSMKEWFKIILTEKDGKPFERDLGSMVMAYCVGCLHDVEVRWEPFTDEKGETTEFPYCPRCGAGINHCYNCDKLKLDSESTPLGQTDGTCAKEGRIHAMDLICNYFEGD